MFIRKDLLNFIHEQRTLITNPNTTGASTILTLLDDLETLRTKDITLFGDDGKKEPSLQELIDYSKLSKKCLVNFDSIQGFTDNTEVVDPGVKNATKNIVDITDTVLSELKPYLRVKQPAYNWNLTAKEKEEADAFIASSLADISGRIDERIRNVRERRMNNSRLLEFPNDRNIGAKNPKPTIPREVQLSGDVNDLAAYYVKNKATLDDAEKGYLKNRIGSMMYLNDLQKNAKPSSPIFGSKKDFFGGELHLTGYKGKYQYQTTGNGCWSCAYAMLLESRGVSLNQQIVRAYRPDMGVNDTKAIGNVDVAGLLSNQFFSPYELADLTSKVLPTSALRQVGTPYFNSKDPASVRNVKEFIKATVTESITKHKSPIAISTGYHFMTIVGLKGDRVRVLNSTSTNPGLEEEIHLDTLLSNQVSVSMTYLQDLQFTKEGKCTNIPENFGKITYDEGKLANASAGSNGANISGESFLSYRQVGNVKFTDTLYLPNEVSETLYNPQKTKEQVKKDSVKPVKQDMPPVMKPVAEPIVKQAAEPVKPTDTPTKTTRTINQVKNTGKVAEKTAKPVSKTTKSAGKDPVSTGVLLNSEVTAAQEQMRHILNKWDNLENPQEAMRFTVATLLADKTLLNAYEQSSAPDKDQTFAKLLNSRDSVYEIAKSEKFNDFYKTMRTDEILKLCEAKPENYKAVQDAFYNKFVNHVPGKTAPENPKLKEESNPEVKNKKTDAKDINKQQKTLEIENTASFNLNI